MDDSMSNSSEVLSTFEIMRRQEETYYVKRDVFHHITAEQSLKGQDRCQAIDINKECRCKMIEWCY